jgi:rhodanese-related sulfurtransferase
VTGPITAARFGSVDELLAAARAGIERLSPQDANARVASGALIVDIRPAWQRENDGEIPGSVIVERNHLEWRLHPASGANLPLASEGQEWIVVCTEGYTSSLAASALVSLGLPAADIVGGIEAWRAAGLPVVPGATQVEHRAAAAS